MGFYYLLFSFFFGFHQKNYESYLPISSLFYHSIIVIFDSLTCILHHSQMLFTYFSFITLFLQSLLWRVKNQKTFHAIKRKIRKIQAPKDLSSLEVFDHSEVGDSTLVSHRFFYYLCTTAPYTTSLACAISLNMFA